MKIIRIGQSAAKPFIFKRKVQRLVERRRQQALPKWESPIL
nr:MAG TPA: hypothetical protein [Caudoviricetes sp.]